MADSVITPFGTTTTNYGWTKPTVGADADIWGNSINSDLDGIDSTVKAVSNSVPAAAVVVPLMDGTAAVGTSAAFARSDHVHPTDTSRASVAQVNALPVAMGDNRIINGDMRIDQHNNGASIANPFQTRTFPIDRWKANGGIAGRFNVGRSLGSPGLLAGFPYCLGVQATSTFTLAAGDYFYVGQDIEADMISDFAWGTASAQSVTLSFWALSSTTGTFGGALQNAASTRSYPFTYSLPAANVWTRIVITIPGDTTGTWTMSGVATSASVLFDLGAGATFRGPANTWASANYIGATGSVSVVAVNATLFDVTGVKLETGSVATPYNRQSLAKSMADCQRYYLSLTNLVVGGYAATGSPVYGSFIFPAMRASPTITPSGIIYNNASALTKSLISPQNFLSTVTVTATGTGSAQFNATFDAEL